MSNSDPFAILEADDRNKLESLLMDFDQDWTPSRLESFHRDILGNLTDEIRQLAILELVKIDLQRSWAKGHERRVEGYLEEFAELGTPEQVDPALIAAELAARRASDRHIDIDEYSRRFPKQHARVMRLVETDRSSQSTKESASSQADIETSRIGTEEIAETTKEPIKFPSEFGRYQLLRELGSGAMGTVYLAYDSQLDRQVALKTPSFEGGDNEEMVERFYREARAAARIQHRNICPVFDVGEIEGQHFISMAFVKGRCLSAYIVPNKLPPPRTSAILVHRLANALANAHRQNIIHRDLKPDNIMIDSSREPVVMDFGLARQTDADSRMTQSGMIVGTPAYMSPEQIQGNPDEVGPAADIYALGVILYESLTGKLPFRGPIAQVVYQIVNEEPRAPSELRPEIDVELELICQKMMAKDLNERYASMDTLAAALGDYLKGRQRSSQSGSDPPEQQDLQAASSNSSTTSPSGELNEFFAERAAADPTQTVMDQVGTDQKLVVKSPSKSPVHFAQRNWPWIAAGFAGLILLAFGLTLILRTPKGILRIVIDDPNIDVIVDGEKIKIEDGQFIGREALGEHRLEFKIGETIVPLGDETTVSIDGETRRVRLTVAGVDILNDEFTITRNGQTALVVSLEHLDESTQELQNSTTEVADSSDDINGSKTSIHISPGFEGQTAGQSGISTDLEIGFQWCPSGSFLMGSPTTDPEARNNETPQVFVELSDGFWMGRTEITQSQWQAIMLTQPWKQDPRFLKEGPDFAASCMTWFDAAKFCERLTKRERDAGRLSSEWEYVLPTEAQWEYACRAGTTSRYSFGEDPSDLSAHAWWGGIIGDGNARRAPHVHAVGTKLANPWNLYDMHGNVWEMCRDGFSASPLGGVDPMVGDQGSHRVKRGGSWSYATRDCRSANRRSMNVYQILNGTGFRVALCRVRRENERPQVPVGPIAQPRKETINIGSRLEPLIDGYLIDELKGSAVQKLHPPDAQEVVFETDQPWEGNACWIHTIFRDDSIYRMYYRGGHIGRGTLYTCYAESKDGIHWERPNIGLIPFDGSTDNNIIWEGFRAFKVFRDRNPSCPLDARYKAIAMRDRDSLALKSPDGIQWSLIQAAPVIDKTGNASPSPTAFWDEHRGYYRTYLGSVSNGLRDIASCSSNNFTTWTQPELLYWTGAPRNHVYTSFMQPYPRAKHLIIGVASRWFPSRGKQVEPVFLSSRDGEVFHQWEDTLIPVSAPSEREPAFSNVMAAGLLRLSDEEFSLYASESFQVGESIRLRRFTMRTDGFVSVSAGDEGGALVTRPIQFRGNELVLNLTTGEKGSARVELLDKNEQPLPGYTLEECEPIRGDSLQHVVRWNGGSHISLAENEPVRLRIELSDADLYSLRFRFAPEDTLSLEDVAHHFSFDGHTMDHVGSVAGQLVGNATIDTNETKSGSGSLTGSPKSTGDLMTADGVAESLNRDYSVSLWFRRSEKQANRDFPRLFAATPHGRNSRTQSSINLNHRYRPKVADGELRLYGEETPIGEWTHLVITRSPNECALYINGELADIQPTVPHQAVAKVEIGGLRNANRDWDGNIDEFTVFSRVISPGEVVALFQDPNLPTELTSQHEQAETRESSDQSPVTNEDE